MVFQPINAQARPKLSARARVQTDKLSGKPVLLYPEGALMLNPTANAIVSFCTGETTVEGIVSALAEKYQKPPNQISDEVAVFLDRLRARNLLELRAAEENSKLAPD